jgi:hypothetical protein
VDYKKKKLFNQSIVCFFYEFFRVIFWTRYTHIKAGEADGDKSSTNDRVLESDLGRRRRRRRRRRVSVCGDRRERERGCADSAN